MLARTISVVAALTLCPIQFAAAQAPPAPAAGAKDHATAIKENLQKSLAALRQYQWVETTVVSMKGAEKSRTQDSCYYGADGKVQKTPIGAPPQQDAKKERGIKGKVVENKKEEISDSVKQAIGLVKQYVPPDPDKIQAAKAAGKISVSPPNPAGQVQMVIKDYLKPGDSLTLIANAATDQITGMVVSTYTDSAKDAVGLKIGFGSFADGTVYPAKINLDIASQQLGIAIENSGYKKAGAG